MWLMLWQVKERRKIPMRHVNSYVKNKDQQTNISTWNITKRFEPSFLMDAWSIAVSFYGYGELLGFTLNFRIFCIHYSNCIAESILSKNKLFQLVNIFWTLLWISGYFSLVDLYFQSGSLLYDFQRYNWQLRTFSYQSFDG